jgi:UDP-N-acetylmuramyl pentapeptide synthase
MLKGVLVLGDALEVGIVEPVHHQALIQQLQRTLQVVVVLFDEGSDVELEFVWFAAVQQD